MNVHRIVEVRTFDHTGQPSNSWDIDISDKLLTKKWPKQVYTMLRACITTCITGGVVTMRGVLTVK
jgi:hypothetical protein